MSSPTRSRPHSPGIHAADVAERPRSHQRAAARSAARRARRAAREASLQAAAHQRAVAAAISAEETAARARARAARKAALPPWYQRKRYFLPGFAILVAAVGTSTYLGTRPVPAPPAPAYVAPTLAAPGIGRTVTDGRFAFTLRSVTYAGQTIGASYSSERAQGTWIVVTADVANTARVAGPLSISSQFLVDTAGNRYPAAMVPSLPGWEQAYIDGIAPRTAISAQIPFDIPAGTVLAALEVRDAQFGTGKKIPLR